MANGCRRLRSVFTHRRLRPGKKKKKKIKRLGVYVTVGNRRLCDGGGAVRWVEG